MKLKQFADPMDRTRMIDWMLTQVEAITDALTLIKIVDVSDEEAIKKALYQIRGRSHAINAVAAQRLTGIESDPAPVDPASIITE